LCQKQTSPNFWPAEREGDIAMPKRPSDYEFFWSAETEKRIARLTEAERAEILAKSPLEARQGT
jgi:hypothetical protein